MLININYYLVLLWATVDLPGFAFLLNPQVQITLTDAMTCNFKCRHLENENGDLGE